LAGVAEPLIGNGIFALCEIRDRCAKPRRQCQY